MRPGGGQTPLRRKRLLAAALVVVLSIGLGLATTVGISWQLARTWRDVPAIMPDESMWSHASGPKWLYSVSRWTGREERQGALASEWASRRTTPLRIVPPPAWSRLAEQAGPHTNLWEQATGWPMLAMSSLQVPTVARNPAQTVDGIDIGSAVNRQGIATRVVLPTRPIWPGFAVDAVAYSIAWWSVLLVLAWVPRCLRRWRGNRRERRGLCPACAYPVGTGPVCTECGTPKPVSVTATTRKEPIG